MRIVLLGAVSLAVALVGFYRASLFSGRMEALDAFIASLTQLGLLIAYDAIPLHEASTRLAKAENAAAPFWAALADELREAPCAQIAWDAAMRRARAGSAKLCALSPEDEAVLCEFAAGLGRSDARTQQAGIELAAARLRPLMTRAKEQSETRGRVSRSLGVLGALAVFITLM